MSEKKVKGQKNFHNNIGTCCICKNNADLMTDFDLNGESKCKK